MEKSVFKKRKYNKKMRAILLAHKKELVQHLQREWDMRERKRKHEEVIHHVYEGTRIIGQGILILLLLAGVSYIALVAPNVIGAIGKMNQRKSFFSRESFGHDIAYLKKQRYIKVKKKGGENFFDQEEYEISLTELGEKHVIQRALGELAIPIPDTWDTIWRIVIFDIPNKHKWERDAFRKHLRIIGFYQLQKSVFVSPYPCKEEFNFLIQLFNIASYVDYIETSHITREDRLKQHFSLK